MMRAPKNGLHGLLTMGGAAAGSLAAGIVAMSISSSCAYLGSAIRQAGYGWRQQHTPEQRVFKHMLTRDTFYVFGTLRLDARVTRDAVAVLALSDRFRKNEVVDVNHFSRPDSYYGLNLPAGDYRLLVVSDVNRDGVFDESEILGWRALSLSASDSPDLVRSGIDIDPAGMGPRPNASFRIPVQKSEALTESFFYPKATIRSLDDPIFSRAMAELGMYEPAAFLEQAPMMFYALEEDIGYKVPVVFVHGIGGSPRDFREIVARLDRTVYRPWFFHYASGGDLAQLSEMFHRLFLSGKVIPLEKMPLVVVAHSMGGLVVRDALNRCSGNSSENTIARLITIASPMGGHPAARSAARAPLVLPSWRDLDPDSAFVARLHRRVLPAGLRYDLYYAFGDARTSKSVESSDGVVPLSSQLTEAAQKEATLHLGFGASHTGVLRDPHLVERVLHVIGEVRAPFPEDHMRVMLKGGYTMTLGANYSPKEKYFIATLGHYMDALVAGELAPIHPTQVHFVEVCRGARTPTDEVESAWLKFNREFPNRGRSE